MRASTRASLSCVSLGLSLLITGSCSKDSVDRAELPGADADGNGVRDDLDGYIAGRDPAYTEYLTAVAANEQRAVTLDTEAPGAKAEAFEILDQVNLLISCVPDGLDRDTARDEADAIVAKVSNTDARRANHASVSEMNSGRAMPAPDCSAVAGPRRTNTPTQRP
jgi:hypothetical protein